MSSTEPPASTDTRQTQWMLNNISTVPTSSSVAGLLDWAFPEQVPEGGAHSRGQDADVGQGHVHG